MEGDIFYGKNCKVVFDKETVKYYVTGFVCIDKVLWNFDIINLYLYSCILTSPKMCMVVLMLSRLVINIHGPACLPP